ncbi:MAG: Nramp family divalent metal transporter [Candidatus Berkelbacteria bacterium]|nr:Nramp family divalent metal transporter [Candidatus Berkelbacteria bacterium]MCR4307930.1 Nramp family divalent metal transporter [Candidatus Berkelbacteria bacterium]
MAKKNIVEEIAELPAKAVEETIIGAEIAVADIGKQEPFRKVKKFWKILGPGLTTGAADDDPSGIATYSQTGAQYGFQLAWLAAFTFPLMGLVQEMCARIGLVTGRGLAANIRSTFPRWVLYLCAGLLFGANTFNIGADLGALAKAAQLIKPEFNYSALVIFFALLCVLMQIFISYRLYAKYLKYLTLLILSYIVTAFLVKDIDWWSVLKSTLVPSVTFTQEQIILICGILGTTISPYLFFWQTSQEVEESIQRNGHRHQELRVAVTDKEIRNMRIDNWSGMLLSNVVMFFIIIVTGATLFRNGITNIGTAADAAAALRPLAGDWAYLLFALGIFGVGLLGIPVLAGSASYAISEAFGWKEGLYRNLKEAYAFYGVIIIAMIVGVLLNFVGLDPIKALIYSAVLNGLVAPIVMVLIVLIGSKKAIMGARVNHPVTTVLGWIATGLMIITGLATIYAIFL